MSNVKISMPERRASNESANNCHPFVQYPQSAKRCRAVKLYIHRARSAKMAKSLAAIAVALKYSQEHLEYQLQSAYWVNDSCAQLADWLQLAY